MRASWALWLLIAVTIAKSTAFLFSKIALATLSPFNLLGVRFSLAFLILCVLFFKKLKGASLWDVRRGAILGAVFFGVMAFEMFALRITDTAATSFLEHTAIVIVPLLESALRRRQPEKRTLLCAGLTLLGVAFLTLRTGLRLGAGEALCLVAAFLFAVSMILTSRFSRRGDPLLLGMLQIGFMGLFAVLASLLFESPRLPRGGAEWGVVLMLTLVCTCFGFALQPPAQKYISVERTAQLCAVNPLSVAIQGAVFRGETLGEYGLLGASLILLGIFLSGRTGAGCAVERPGQPES